MSSLLSEAVLVVTAGLVALPLVSRRFRRALRPKEHVRFNTATMVGAVDVTAAVAAFTAGELADPAHALSTPQTTRPGWQVRGGSCGAAGGMTALSVAILV